MLAAILALVLASLSGCATIGRVASAASGLGPPEPALPPGVEASPGDAELDRRLAFLTRALDDDHLHAAAWQYGWLAVNAGGGAASAAQAATDSGTDRDYDIIEAGKSAIGVAYLLIAPMPGRHGADPIRDMPDATRADRLARLRRAEELLHAAAARAEERTHWAPHVGNVAFNLASAIPLFILGDAGNGALALGLDTAVGAVQIFTQPWNPAQEWQEYLELVATGQPPVPERHVRWRVGPHGPGLALALSF